MFHKSSLIQIKSKQNKWYVVVTKPKELAHTGKQIRRSTGTSDLKEAEKLQHSITDDIYRLLDRQLVELGFAPIRRETHTDFRTRMQGADKNKVDRMLAHTVGLYAQIGDAMELAEFPKTVGPTNPVAAPIPAETTQHALPLSKAIPMYLESRVWDREQTKNSAKRALERFTESVGPKYVTEIEKAHAYRFAKHLDNEGYANKTIRTHLSFVSPFLSWLEREEIIKSSPFTNLVLKSYGNKSQGYRPFSRTELTELFSLKMKPDHRLLFAILISTGMRLDEAALLNHEDIKISEDGIKHYDLTGSSVVKNKGSKRLVPVHPSVKIPNGQGRLFPRFKTNADGKTNTTLSSALMKHIRKVTDDKKKVVHSLRGTFKDMLRDVDVSKEINDFITGHSSGDEASKYGSGPSLQVRLEAITKLNLDFIKQPKS
jgi:integrase